MRQLKITKSITNRETASLDKYLQDIGKVELITAEEEVQLAQKIRQGDMNALDKLVKANLRFVVSVAKQYQNQGLSLPDLINEGNLGLMKAARRFDETRGFKFISYAVWWIRQGILQALAEQAKQIRLPLNQIGIQNRLKKAREGFIKKEEREATNEELSGIMELAEKKVQDAKDHRFSMIAGDQLVDEDNSESNFFNTYKNPNALPTDRKLIEESLKKDIERVLSTLPQKDADVLRLYFGLGGVAPMTLEEIGNKYDMTRERIRQIKEKGIRQLKHISRSRLLKQYLG